jgi:hypothetical protein
MTGQISDLTFFTNDKNQTLLYRFKATLYFEQLVDSPVYELYFPDEIKAAGKAILPHLGNLTPITDKMSKKEKLSVIEREFERLYAPRHTVRNHIETLDSVQVVKIIREALNR